MRTFQFNPSRRCGRVFAVFCLSVVWGTRVAPAAAIAPGNLVVYRVGDGSGFLTANAAPVFLDEYSPAGALIQTISLSSAGSPFTAVGNAPTEGIISVSPDGQSMHFTGYAKTPGAANPAGDLPTTTARLIGELTPDGSFSSLVNTDAPGSIRSATASGSFVYFTTTSGLRFTDSAAGASSVLIDVRNSRQALLTPDHELIVSNGSTATFSKIQSYGFSPSPGVLPTPLVDLSSAAAVNGFWLADLDPGVPGVDTMYALEQVSNQLLKYSLLGASWSQVGALPGNGAFNIVGVRNGDGVDLYLSGSTFIHKLTDLAGFNAPMSPGAPELIVTGATGTAFRGVGVFTPVPEPCLLALFAMGLSGLFGRRRVQ